VFFNFHLYFFFNTASIFALFFFKYVYTTKNILLLIAILIKIMINTFKKINFTITRILFIFLFITTLLNIFTKTIKFRISFFSLAYLYSSSSESFICSVFS